jgi:hypothetical protein
MNTRTTNLTPTITNTTSVILLLTVITLRFMKIIVAMIPKIAKALTLSTVTESNLITAKTLTSVLTTRIGKITVVSKKMNALLPPLFLAFQITKQRPFTATKLISVLTARIG